MFTRHVWYDLIPSLDSQPRSAWQISRALSVNIAAFLEILLQFPSVQTTLARRFACRAPIPTCGVRRSRPTAAGTSTLLRNKWPRRRCGRPLCSWDSVRRIVTKERKDGGHEANFPGRRANLPVEDSGFVHAVLISPGSWGVSGLCGSYQGDLLSRLFTAATTVIIYIQV